MDELSNSFESSYFWKKNPKRFARFMIMIKKQRKVLFYCTKRQNKNNSDLFYFHISLLCLVPFFKSGLVFCFHTNLVRPSIYSTYIIICVLYLLS